MGTARGTCGGGFRNEEGRRRPPVPARTTPALLVALLALGCAGEPAPPPAPPSTVVVPPPLPNARGMMEPTPPRVLVPPSDVEIVPSPPEMVVPPADVTAVRPPAVAAAPVPRLQPPGAGAWAVSVLGTPFYLAFKAVTCVASAAIAAPVAALAGLTPEDGEVVALLGAGVAENCGPPYVLMPPPEIVAPPAVVVVPPEIE